MTQPSTAPSDRTGFVQAIGRLDGIALVAGSMIGAGIFITPADMMRQVHAPSLFLLAWVVGGFVTFAGALTFGELAAMFPRAGGLYVYLREGISPLFGFLYGWTLFTVIWSGGIAAASVGFTRFASVLFPSLTPDVFLGGTVHLPTGDIVVGLSAQRLLAVTSIVVLTAINIRGVKTAALLQTVFTAIKVASLAALILLALTIGRQPEAVAANFGPGFWPATGLTAAMIAAIGTAMVGPIFTMDGWYSAAFAASEFKNPKRDLPFALGMGVGTVALAFVLTNIAYLMALPASGVANAPQDLVAAAALQAMLGDVGRLVIAIAVTISVLGLNNGLLLGGARIYYAMAQDGLFFKSIGTLHPRYRTPAVALTLQAAWICTLCLSGTYSQLLEYVTTSSVLFWGLTGMGLFVLRIRRPDAERPVKVWGYPWLPALFVLTSFAISANLMIQRPQYSLPGIFIVGLGVPVYLWQRWRSGRT